MKKSYIFIITLAIVSLLSMVIYSVIDNNYLSKSPQECKPTFPDGDGPYYKQNSPMRAKLVPDKNNGEKLIVKGKILQNDCKTPVANAILDIWQANEKGNYQDEWYRGKVQVNSKGNYTFETVVPKGYGEGTAYRPPHIHFKVFVENKLIITSEMFFPEVKGKPGFNDEYIMDLKTKEKNEKNEHQGYHDIILP